MKMSVDEVSVLFGSLKGKVQTLERNFGSLTSSLSDIRRDVSFLQASRLDSVKIVREVINDNVTMKQIMDEHSQSLKVN